MPELRFYTHVIHTARGVFELHRRPSIHSAHSPYYCY